MEDEFKKARERKGPQKLNGASDTDNVVDIAISRMKTGAVVKEERTQKFKFIAIAAVVIAGLAAFSQLDFVFKTPVSETSPDGNTVVTIELNNFGSYYAKGKINGEPVKFIVDTGATQVAIPLSVAKKLDLPLGRKFSTKTANGTGTSYETSIKSISLGDITLSGVDASVSEGLDGEEILLGMSFLRRTRVETDKGVMKVIY